MQVSELHERVRQASAIPFSDVDTSPVQATLAEAIRAHWLADHFRRVLGNESLCSQLASESYLHPNGFEKYGLVPLSDSMCRIRLHIWRPENKRRYDDANYHSHVRDFTSIVLQGQLSDLLFTETSDPSLARVMDLRKYRVHDRPIGGQYVFDELGTSSLTMREERLLRPLQAYSLPYLQVHKTAIPGDATTMTVFVQGPEKSAHSLVYSSTGYQAEKDAGTGCITVDSYKSALKQALRAITSQPSPHAS